MLYLSLLCVLHSTSLGSSSMSRHVYCPFVSLLHSIILFPCHNLFTQFYWQEAFGSFQVFAIMNIIPWTILYKSGAHIQNWLQMDWGPKCGRQNCTMFGRTSLWGLWLKKHKPQRNSW
jgi:hypothetical protein